MREYYAWERERVPVNETTAMNLIDILISDEPPNDMPNLKEVDIPEDIQEQFHKDDEKEKIENESESTCKWHTDNIHGKWKY